MSSDVEVIPVIRTRLLRRGNGKETPIRIIEQYWDMQGDLMWEVDPLAGEENIKVGQP